MTKKMRHLALLSIHSSPVGQLGGKDTGGMSVYIRELARELGERGFFLDIFTRRQHTEQPLVMPLSPNVRLIHLPGGPVAPLDKLEIYQYLPALVEEMEQFRRQQQIHYDVIYSHYWLSGWVGEQLQQRWGVPHLMMFHTVGASKQESGVGPAEPALRLQTEERLAQSCDRLVAATFEEKQQLMRHYATGSDHIRIVPCGVSLQRFRLLDRVGARERCRLPADEKVILYVGRIEALKGIERLVGAISLINGEQAVRLVIVGGDDASQVEVERLREQAFAAGVGEAVDFRGLVEHDELPSFYNAADVCAVVSYYESFGLVALEALACGTPVIASDVGILRTLINRPEMGAVLSVDHDSAQLAACLTEYLFTPSPDRQLVRSAVKAYGWDNVAQRFEQVLAELARP